MLFDEDSSLWILHCSSAGHVQTAGLPPPPRASWLPASPLPQRRSRPGRHPFWFLKFSFFITRTRFLMCFYHQFEKKAVSYWNINSNNFRRIWWGSHCLKMSITIDQRKRCRKLLTFARQSSEFFKCFKWRKKRSDITSTIQL